MIHLALLVCCFPVQTPKEALEEVVKHYQSLKSFTATVECHDASGLFPGNYTQTLKWKKGNRFELLVTVKSDFVKVEGNPGSEPPDYFSNGKEVLMQKYDGASSTRSMDMGPNTMPGWEVSGGPILGWLLDSPSSKFFLSTPEGFKLSYAWGDRKEWEGTEVREVKLKMGGPLESASLVPRSERAQVGWAGIR